MPEKEHRYSLRVEWTGNLGQGTTDYRGYSRNHEIGADGKALTIPGSSDPAFRGDPARYNPEEMLVASLSTCHMLWVLHLCSEAGIVVTAYVDSPSGTMVEFPDGSGAFREVVLRPKLSLADPNRAIDLSTIHRSAHRLCFIARSVNFPVRVEPY